MADHEAPSVWVGSLAAYEGAHDGVPRLIGRWVDAIDAEDITVAQLHAGTGAPYDDDDELYCLDTSGMPSGTGEMSPSEAAEWGRAFESVDEHMRPAYRAWCGTVDLDDGPPDTDDFVDAYAGEWDSMAEFAYRLVEDLGMLADVPEEVARYFDHDAYARDLRLSGDYTTVNAPGTGVFVFRSL